MTKRRVRPLRPTLENLLLTHGLRDTLESLRDILAASSTDEIDARLIRGLDKAGRAYASAMGLPWRRL